MMLMLAAAILLQSRIPSLGPAIEKLGQKPWFLILPMWILLCIGALTVYRNQPLSMDEYSAWFQGQIFAAGQMSGRFPPELLDRLIPKGFQGHFLTTNHVTGAVATAYWPGFSLLLAPFAALGIPWACNPTITAVSLYVLWRIAGELQGSDNTGQGWALLLAAGSPCIWANGISYYSMPTHLLLNLVFTWLLLQPTPRRLLLAGLTGSWALVLHNPFPHTLFALPWIVWLLCQKRGWLKVGWLALGYLPLTLLLGVGWMLFQRELVAAMQPITGHATVSGNLAHRIVVMSKSLLNHFRWPGDTLVLNRTAGLAKLWLWSTPLLPLLAWQGARIGGDPRLKPMAAAALLTFFGYFIIPFDQGHGWGYRYFHPAFGLLPLLALPALVGAPKTLTRVVAIAAIMSLVLATSLRGFQINDFMQQHLAQMPPTGPQEARQIMFFRPTGYYAHDLEQNDPWLRGKRIMIEMQDQEQDEALLQRYFPGTYTVEENRHGRTYTQRLESVHSGTRP